jgi:DNA topoisomerase I
VDVERDFWPLYVIPESKKQHVKDLKKLVKDADEIFLATDEDREGESISWHLLETLQPKKPVKRLVFHEITKAAIQKALESPREIDMALVEAQETRRIVDRLYGYRVSPLLWKKMARGLSAGRVQSVAMRLLVERERERIRFKKAEFWGLRARFAKQHDRTSGFRRRADARGRAACGGEPRFRSRHRQAQVSRRRGDSRRRAGQGSCSRRRWRSRRRSKVSRRRRTSARRRRPT